MAVANPGEWLRRIERLLRSGPLDDQGADLLYAIACAIEAANPDHDSKVGQWANRLAGEIMFGRGAA